MRGPVRALGRAIAVLVGYAAAIVGLTWPLGAHLATHLPDTVLPCRCDTLYMAWILARESRWLATRAVDFTDAGIFYPARQTLFYGDTGFGALPWFLPTFLATGNPTLAVNLVFLGGVALTATAIHLVVRHWTASHAAGFVAGATFLSSSWVLRLFIPSAPSYAVLVYLPVLIAVVAVPSRRVAGTLRALPLVVLQSLTDVVYLAAATFAPLVVLALARILRPSTRTAGLGLAAVLALALLALAPVYAGHLAVRHTEPFGSPWQAVWVGGWHLTLPWVPFLLGPLVLPGVVWLVIVAGLVAHLVRRDGAGDESGGKRARAGWLHAGFWAITGFLASLPPELAWQGRPDVTFTLPHLALARWLGIYEIVRVPGRLALASLVGVALLAGLGFGALLGWLPAGIRRLGSVLAGAAVVGTITVGYARALPTPVGAYPLQKAVRPDTAVVTALRGGSGPVLELPIGRGDDVPAPNLQARAMYRAIFYDRPLVNGYSSYWPLSFLERMRAAADLPAPAAVAELRRTADLATVVVRLAEMPEASRAPWFALKGAGGGNGLAFVLRDGTDLVFDVRSAPATGVTPPATPPSTQGAVGAGCGSPSTPCGASP